MGKNPSHLFLSFAFALAFTLTFFLSLDSPTPLNHALNPANKIVISTGAQRSGEICFSTSAANPPPSKVHHKKSLHRAHPLRRPKPSSNPRPGLHTMPRQHRRHASRNPASLSPRHHPADLHRRRPLRRHPRPLQTPPLIQIATIIASEKTNEESPRDP
jgi:hypothetical protein